MKKRDQIALIKSAIEAQTNRKAQIEAKISNPTVLRLYDTLSGRIEAYSAALELLEGSGVSIRIDCY